MGVCRALVAAALAAGVLAAPALAAQQPPEPVAVPTPEQSPEPAAAPRVELSPAQIRQELEKIKKGRTLSLTPALGTDDSDGETLLRVDNASPFDMIVFVVGPTTERIELGPDKMQVLTVKPGDYEIAVTVVGRDVPPFYGKQKIVENMRFRHQFVIPAI